jgi:hypothetical protein
MRDLNNLYEMLVRPKGRTPADEYPHKGDIWIEGRSNSWYEIELINRSPSRVMVIVSVDGVGVVDGAPASYDSRGFVLKAHETLRVPGWVNSNQSAAQFVFSDVKRSYANQMGQGGNPGVIGAAWFVEKQPVYVQHAVTSDVFVKYPKTTVHGTANWDPRIMRGMAVGNTLNLNKCTGVPTTLNVQPQNVCATLGTAWGEQTTFLNEQTAFEKASTQPHTVMVIRYDHADNLRAMGIRLKERVTSSSSQAFPGNNTYCKPPPVWATTRK